MGMNTKEIEVERYIKRQIKKSLKTTPAKCYP
jgi:hypothetical protein